MSSDPMADKLFEMKLKVIFEKYSWLQDQLSFIEFKELFPVNFKKGRPVGLDKPAFDLDREIFLEVLIAFKQSYPPN
ncbi:hypothetical protein [Desertivirga brevis]|uniref:hypothetical protein n=1 Tax=Desertivirga brevis TaxID=2810310 RepID=UPI001A96E55C|nr:hypothetical protein [Pedobacter sp. SYSU D00873]